MCSKTMNKDKALKCAHEYSTSLNYNITDSTLQIRSIIQKWRSSCIDLPSPFTAEALIKGHTEPPNDFLQFLHVPYTSSQKIDTHENVDGT